ncbi:MAG: ATP-binding protein [Thermoplasmatales archaeon]|nr:ATP-binding protein [Thermoplasmatales archaeon]
MARKLVERKRYLKILDHFKDDNRFIKVITGVRRCGKSTLLAQHIDKLKGSGVSDGEILSLNLESSDCDDIVDHRDLSELIYGKVPRKGRFYLFLDEVQRVENWEKTVNALMVDTEADIYITGSNSRLLSSELSTYLTGRYVSINMFPLSFGEYLELYPTEDVAASFDRYLLYGGFPGLERSDDTFLRTSLRDLLDSIVFRDVVQRGDVRNVGELEKLVRFLMMNIGNPMSLGNIAKGLGGGIHRNTVEKYVDLLERACILYRADRYDIRSTALNPSPKYYSVDTGLRNSATGYASEDYGRMLENVVYLELLRRGYGVVIGKWDSKEVDFVAKKPMGGREYFQVCYSMRDEATAERELAPLRKIADNFPKTVLAMDVRVDGTTRDGIIVRDAVRWLLDDPE